MIPQVTESRIQQNLIRWWGLFHRRLGVIDERLLLAFPLQGARSPRNGARMKAEGMRRGTPDLLLAVARSGMHGLFIELKTETGRVSPFQESLLISLQNQHYSAVLVRGFDQATTVIELYLAGKLT